MSLRLVQRPGSTAWYVRGTVRGTSVFESTGTADRQRAEAFRAKREAELWDRSVYGARATVTFAHAVASYLEAKPRSRTTKTHLQRLLDHFRTTPLQRIDQEALDRAYKAILTPKAGEATKLRAVLSPLRAVLEHAAIRRWCDRPAFEPIKVAKSPTTFLKPAEATALVQAAAPHLQPLLIFLIGTGVRMSEALDLTWSAVDLTGATAVVWQKQRTERVLELPPVVVAALSRLPHREGAVFRPVLARRPAGAKRGRRTGDRYMDTGRTGGGQIKTAWATACRKAGLPGHWREWTPQDASKPKRAWIPDITPHDLRHTWATWDYCIHRDLLGLRDRGGWTTIEMVTRYSHRLSNSYQVEITLWLKTATSITKLAI